MLLPTGVLFLTALGNVFDREVRLYPHENFSPTPKYSYLCIFALTSLSSMLTSPLGFSFTTTPPVLSINASKLAFQA